MTTFGILHTRRNGQQEIVMSGAGHDCNSSSDGRVSVDGGQPSDSSYQKLCYDDEESFQRIWFEYKNVTHADLYNDWNLRKNKLRNIYYPTSKITILEEKDYPDINSFDWAVETMIWGTVGENQDQPRHHIMLKDASKSHLQAILRTVWHIPESTRKIIEYIIEAHPKS